MKITSAIDAFILDCRLKGNTDKTISGYKGFLSRFNKWLVSKGIEDLTDLTLQKVQQYQLYIDTKPAERSGGEKLSKRSVQTYIRHIKAFLSYCHREEYISLPIHSRLRLPKAERPAIEILTADEVNLILSCFTKSESGLRNRALFILFLDSGLRLSEAVGLKSENINLDKGYIKLIGKGRRERIVPIGLKVRRAFLAYIHKRRTADDPADDKYFFLSKERLPISAAGVSSLFNRLKKRTGIFRLHAHLLRHTFATNFLIHGLGDVYELSRILGHSEIKVTEMYLQLASFYTIIEKKRRFSYMDLVHDGKIM